MKAEEVVTATKATETREQVLPQHQKLVLAFVRDMISGVGREDDEHPTPPGPWDPVIRVALEQVTIRLALERINSLDLLSPILGPSPEPWRSLLVSGPQPEPWRTMLTSVVARNPKISTVSSGGLNVADTVALNPQPLPPRFTFLTTLASAVIGRAELIQEMGAMARRSESEGDGVASEYVSGFVDDVCGNGFRFRWPFPGPRPNWFIAELSGVDLVVMATRFEDAGKEAFNRGFGRHLVDGGSKLTEAGLSKMQHVRT